MTTIKELLQVVSTNHIQISFTTEGSCIRVNMCKRVRELEHVDYWFLLTVEQLRYSPEIEKSLNNAMDQLRNKELEVLNQN